MALRRVDLGVLLVSLAAIVISLQQEGDLRLSPVFYEELDASTFVNGYGPDLSEHVPAPIVTDLDGDGLNEIVLVTRDPKIKILRAPRPASSTSSSSSTPASPPRATAPNQPADDDTTSHALQLEVMYETSLLSSVKIRKGRQVVALHTGYLDSYEDSRARTQVVVVVTEGWNVLCFDYQLKLMWERAIEADLTRMFLGEVAAVVTSHAMREGDGGAVVVGGRLHERLDDRGMYTLHQTRKYGQPSMEDDGDDDDDEVNEAEVEDEDPLGVGDRMPDVADDTLRMGEPQHFSFYAFEGNTGALRWKHEAEDFHEEAPAADLLRPQHEHHSGEVDWRSFRSDVTHSLPHRWATRGDTAFVLAHYERRRSGKDRQRHMRDKMKHAVPHTHVVDLPFGGLKPHLPSEHIVHPNALVAHVRDGIEVLHLFSGRTLCRLTLKRGALHVDVNGDGVIDHVEAVGSMDTIMSGSRRSKIHHLPRCLSIVSSGVPPSYQLHNGTICRTDMRALAKLFASGKSTQTAAFDPTVEDEENVLVALPTVLLHHEPTHALQKAVTQAQDAHKAHRTQIRHTAQATRRFDTVFMVSSGVVTSYAHDGSPRWQTQTESSWSVDDDAREADAIRKFSMLPTVTPMRLRTYGIRDHVVAVGERALTLLSNDGKVRSTADLEDVPVLAPIIADLNNDGWNDIILTTTHGYYGFVLERRIGTRLFTVLIGFLLTAVAVTVVLNVSDQKVAPKRPSSREFSRSRVPSSSARRKEAKAL